MSTRINPGIVTLLLFCKFEKLYGDFDQGSSCAFHFQILNKKLKTNKNFVNLLTV